MARDFDRQVADLAAAIIRTITVPIIDSLDAASALTPKASRSTGFPVANSGAMTDIS